MNGFKTAVVTVVQWLIFGGGWCIVQLLMLFGRIKVVGLKAALPHVHKGSVVIAANHPSLVEPFVLGGILFPAFVFHMRKCPWSIPDKNFYAPRAHWFTVPALKHIPLIRGDTLSGIAVLKEIVRKLRHGDNIIIHPEGGRTCKGSRFAWNSSRRMRVIRSNIASCTIVGRGKILPVWIDFYDETPESFFSGLWQMMWKRRMIIYFGEVYEPNRDETRRERNLTLAEKILSA